MGFRTLLEVLSAHSARHAAGSSRHSTRSPGLGGYDIIDPQDHDRGVGGRAYGLLAHPERLEDVVGDHVLDMTGEDVHSGVLLHRIPSTLPARGSVVGLLPQSLR